MNWSKNVYTFMLGAIIVLSGCMGAGTTEGMEEDDAGGTTVINNYYWNNTTTEVNTELPEMIAIGGVVIGNATGTVGHNWTAEIHTNAGEMMKIHEANVGTNVAGATSYMRITSECADYWPYEDYMFFDSVFAGVTITGSLGYMPGSAFDCAHAVDIVDGDVLAQNISWSLVYSIVPVTVG